MVIGRPIFTAVAMESLTASAPIAVGTLLNKDLLTSLLARVSISFSDAEPSISNSILLSKSSNFLEHLFLANGVHVIEDEDQGNWNDLSAGCVWVITSMYVSETHRGQGIGGKMVREGAISDAEIFDVSELIVNVGADDMKKEGVFFERLNFISNYDVIMSTQVGSTCLTKTMFLLTQM